MQTQNAIFDEFAKLMTEAAGAADGVRREAETVFRSRLQTLLADMDLVTREEFDAVKDMARLAREAGIGDDVMSADERASLFIARIREMNKRFGIPDHVEALKEEDIPRIARAARAEARWTYAVPRYMRRHTAEWIVSKMLPNAPDRPQPDEPDVPGTEETTSN